MKVSVLLFGNSVNTISLASEKGKVARQQQVVRQAGAASQWRTHVYSLRAERDS